MAEEKVTLHIDDTELRLLTARGASVERWGSAALEPGVVSEGLIADGSRLGLALDALFSKHQARRHGVIVSLSGLRSVTRLINIPRMKPSLVSAAIEQEAKRELPVPVETLYLHWQSIAFTEQEQKFFLLGIPREFINANVATLRQCRVEPRSMDLKPLALVRAVNKDEAIVADLEASSLDIVMVVGGIPVIMRSLVLRQGLSLQEAASRLVEELSRTVRYYNSIDPSRPLPNTTPLYLTGKLGREAEVSKLVASGVDFKIEGLDPPLQCPPSLPLGEYMVNIGLALKRS